MKEKRGENYRTEEGKRLKDGTKEERRGDEKNIK